MQTCRGHYIYREIPPKNYHTFTFALCDFPKIGNLMTADMAHRKKTSSRERTHAPAKPQIKVPPLKIR